MRLTRGLRLATDDSAQRSSLTQKIKAPSLFLEEQKEEKI